MAPWRSGRTHPRRPLVVGAVVAVVGASAAVGLGWPDSPAPARAAGQTPTTATAKVVRTDLATTQQVYGSLTFAGTYGIVNPAGTTVQAAAQADQAVAGAQTAYNGAAAAIVDTEAVNNASLAQAQSALGDARATLANDQAQRADTQTINKDQAAVDSAQTTLSLTEAKNTQALDQAQAAASNASQALANAQAQRATADQDATVAGGAYTQLPAVGQRVSQGQVLYAIDGRPIPLLYGTVTPWRVITPGMGGGPDVAQLMSDLATLGFGGPPSTAAGPYGPEEVAEVERWQSSLGQVADGVVRLGQVVFAPDALRVTAVHVAPGAAAAPGQAVLDATGVNPDVTLPLSVDKEHLAHVGDAVKVDLPDGKTTASGHVTAISDVATAAASANPQQGTAAPAPATNPSNNGPQATVTVTITLDGFNQQTGIDEEPVTIELTDQRADGVLAVPVNALLALSGGGYGVRTVSGARTAIVPVQTGLFADTMVQVSGPGLAEGVTVEVPAT